jgi:hypothetical protein
MFDAKLPRTLISYEAARDAALNPSGSEKFVVGAYIDTDWSECRYTVPLVDSGGHTRLLKARGVEYTVCASPTIVPSNASAVFPEMAGPPLTAHQPGGLVHMVVGRDNLQWHPRRIRESPQAADNLTLFVSRFPPEYLVKQTVLTTCDEATHKPPRHDQDCRCGRPLGRSMPSSEKRYIHNWLMSIFAAERVHNLEFTRCLRLIGQVVMPNSGPPIDLAGHAKQDDYSNLDERALVTWAKVLEDMIDTGNSELYQKFREACNKVFALEGLPDMLANGPWFKPPPLSGVAEGPSSSRVRLAQTAQGLFSNLAAPLAGSGDARRPEMDLVAGDRAVGRSAKPERLAPDRSGHRSQPPGKTMAAERRTGPRDRGKEVPWHQRARAVLKDVPGGPLTVEDIVNFFANHDPSPVQTALLNQFINEEGDPVEIMTRLLEELQALCPQTE